MPCNLNQRELAQDVKRGIREAGGTPMEFNTIAISDGVSMGTEGMRASLVSREVIADSIELVARGHLFDGLVCLVACDKTNPAAVMALGRLDIPAVVLYTGSIAPGVFRGTDVTVADVYEAIGGYAAGTRERRGAARARVGRLPRRRRVRRPVHRQHDVDDPRVPGDQPARAERDPGALAEEGRRRRRVRPARRRPRPPRRPAVADRHAARRSRTPPPRWSRPAARRTACCTCSRSPASSALEFTIDDFDRIAGRTPVLADMKPWGRFHATDVYRAGGVALVARELAKQGLVHGELPTVDGRTLGEVATAVVETEGQEVVATIDTADQEERLAADPARQPRAGRLRGQADRRPHAAPRARPGSSTPSRRRSPRSRPRRSSRATSS